jgi:hypothetical protein
MPRHGTFSFEIPIDDPEAMDVFQKAMDEYHDELTHLIKKEAEELGIPIGAMSDVWYLRSRSRWTQEKEDYLIRLAKDGKPLPNIMEDFRVE